MEILSARVHENPFTMSGTISLSARIEHALLRRRWLGAGWSSPVARQAHNLKVAGSNPAPATKDYIQTIA